MTKFIFSVPCLVSVLSFIVLVSSIPLSFAEGVEFTNLRTVDFLGNQIFEVSQGQAVQITADITNNQGNDQDFAYVITTDNLEHAKWITGRLAPGQSLSPALSYTFETEEVFSIKVYLSLLPAYVLDKNNPNDFSGFSKIQNHLSPPLSAVINVGGTQPSIATTSSKPIPNFVDPKKDPYHYIDRYNNEPSYKEWFDTNYSSYTIYEAVGLDKPKVPQWIQNNARWWSDDKINDSEFTNGIEYLIKEKILQIDELPESSTTLSQEIPPWVKNNAGWWADGQISEDDFINGIKFLVENGLIQV